MATARRRRTDPPSPLFTIITGLSGAGRSEAAKCLEDLGFFIVDNMPPALIEKMADLVLESEIKRVGLVVDARGGEFFSDLEKALAALNERGISHRIVFLEAGDAALVRRFESTRRRHPLSRDDRVTEGIQRERRMMSSLREAADLIVDTGDLTPHDLREKLRAVFSESPPEKGIAVNVVSFGYKHGIPLDADLVFDCRFLPNPHWDESLRQLTGTHRRVRGFVLTAPGAEEFLSKIRDLLSFLLPGFVSEGRHYLTIGVGCTGGKHRSVVIADEITRFVSELGLSSSVLHRDMEKE